MLQTLWWFVKNNNEGEMTLSIRISNLEKAMRESKSKNIVRYKYKKYMEEYDNKEKNVRDKITYRELSYEYFKYMNDGERNE